MTLHPAPATTVHPTQPSPGEVDLPAPQSVSGAVVSLLAAFVAVRAALQQHPDAHRQHGDGDPARVNGLQQVQLLANGDISIVWSWGVVTLPAATSAVDLANYLRRVNA